jgi:3-oxoacyl-[acyl-carrier-protein] synthase II
VLGDIAEAVAIHSIFGKDVPVSSYKGHMGHTLGAAGALETIVLLEMLDRQEVVPTLNLKRPDPDCSGINLVQSVDKLPLQGFNRGQGCTKRRILNGLCFETRKRLLAVRGGK